jgi:uncharacterized membrane protein YbhN (UPF0104 family)
VNRLHRVVAGVRRRTPRPSVGTDLLDAVDRLRTDRTSTATLLVAAVAGKLIGAAGLALTLHGLDIPLGTWKTLLVYTITLMAAWLGPLPAGVGTTEAALGALLVTSGTAPSAAAAAVVVFRLIDLWLPVLVGGLAALHLRRAVAAVAAPSADVADPLPDLTRTRRDEPRWRRCR